MEWVMDLVWLTGSLFVLILGLIGCILPIIPGPPISWIGLWILWLGRPEMHPSSAAMIGTGIATVVVMVMDYILPSWGTKKLGGTKAGIRGSTVGLIIGLFFGIPGILFGPFIGAFVGELTKDSKDISQALTSAIGSFLGFLLGTGLKLMVSGWMLYLWLKITFTMW